MSKNTRRASAAFKGLDAPAEPTKPTTKTAAATSTRSTPAVAEKPSKYTVLLSDSDALMWDELAVTLRRDLGRRVDKSSIVRALVYLAAEDESLRRQLAETLNRENVTA